MFRTSHRNDTNTVSSSGGIFSIELDNKTCGHEAPTHRKQTQASRQRPRRPRRRRYSLCDFETKRSKPVVCKWRVLYCVLGVGGWARKFRCFFGWSEFIFRQFFDLIFLLVSTRRTNFKIDAPLSYHSHFQLVPQLHIRRHSLLVFGEWKGIAVCAVFVCAIRFVAISASSERTGDRNKVREKKKTRSSENNMRARTGDS